MIYKSKVKLHYNILSSLYCASSPCIPL